MVRKSLEKLWLGRCTVKIFEEVENPITHITSQRELIKYEDIKCKLSYKTIAITVATDGPAKAVQQTKLSLGNEYDIPPGCEIIVTQSGITKTFTRSGEPAVYRDHQEIVLDKFGGYA